MRGTREHLKRSRVGWGRIPHVHAKHAPIPAFPRKRGKEFFRLQRRISSKQDEALHWMPETLTVPPRCRERSWRSSTAHFSRPGPSQGKVSESKEQVGFDFQVRLRARERRSQSHSEVRQPAPPGSLRALRCQQDLRRSHPVSRTVRLNRPAGQGNAARVRGSSAWRGRGSRSKMNWKGRACNVPKDVSAVHRRIHRHGAKASAHARLHRSRSRQLTAMALLLSPV